jgi:hypothetical protein
MNSFKVMSVFLSSIEFDISLASTGSSDFDLNATFGYSIKGLQIQCGSSRIEVTRVLGKALS